MTQPKWTDERIAEASRLWRAGADSREIAKRLGVSTHSVNKLSQRKRSLFPYRYEVLAALSPVVSQPANDHPDRVVRRTLAGALVTMPRVTMIDGRAA